MIKVETIQKGERLFIDLDLVRDRLPENLLELLNKDPFGRWMGGFKLVDGGVGLVLEFEDGTKYWFFEEELYKVET